MEISLQSSFQPGMKLEVANRSSPDSYWVASIITTCGQLLLLRFSGYGDDRKADFWCDVMTAELHPVGWCSLNNKNLTPPEGRHPTVKGSWVTGGGGWSAGSRCVRGHIGTGASLLPGQIYDASKRPHTLV